jgi:OmpA-OmpF porin, OOP family
MRCRNALLAAVSMFPVAVEAQAPPQPVRGIYLGVAGGLSIETNPDVNGVVSSSLSAAGRSAPSTNLLTGTGGAAVSSLGYGLGNGLRVEVEGNYRTSGAR